MASQYFAILTDYGTRAFAQALSQGQPLQLTQFAVGDGNGQAVTPTASATALVHQTHIAPVSAVSLDPRNNKQVIVELTIPENIGGFYIREMGVFDAQNKLIAYANCPESFKPTENSGSGKVQVLRMILKVESSSTVTLSIDNSVIFVTRQQMTPKAITATTQNGFDESGHTHEIAKASTSQQGIVQLTNDTGLESESLALTAKAGKKLAQQTAQLQLNVSQNYIQNSKKSSAVDSNSADDVATSAAVKTAYDKGVAAEELANKKWTAKSATETEPGILPISHKTDGADKNKFASEYAVGEAAKKGLPVGAVVSFPRAVTNPVGFLKANGTTFNQQTFPDLYRVLGNSNQLPDLTRSDVGMTAYFAVDNIPAGWIAFDEIATQVTEQRYPELYRHLVGKYGAMNRVPRVADRFLRNAGNSLSVGQTQEDELKRHTHKVFSSEPSHRSASIEGLKNDNNLLDAGLVTAIGDNEWRDNGWMTPDVNSNFATGGDETRPKSLILKLCIKALNSFDDVVFWIKSHGEVTNTGALDAGRLAQGLQDKAERNHTHTVSQITDFNQSVREIVTQSITQGFTQNLAETGWCKLPNGMILQWGRVRNEVVTYFPIAFPVRCCAVTLGQIMNVYSYDAALYFYNKTNFKAYIQRGEAVYMAIGY
ncbi:phage tail protein [Haemophilus influenzae]|uniref:phage tail protein n=1 Tax=Haemophilus influenzae TaxID=727 RepID=UPI000D017BDC|nr:phage tail protein [Haemophilus influenzae]PRL64172.1 phage tail fiber repeat protein [Haemophilus influenzae]PRL65195.1 phage tail fiber repeat protein [Haemophilus influenzae]